MSSSRMEYFGNCVKQGFTITITGALSNSRTALFADCGFWPDNRIHTTSGVTLTAAGSCGYLVNLATEHTAITKIFVEWKGFTSSEVEISSGGGATQPTVHVRGVTRVARQP